MKEMKVKRGTARRNTSRLRALRSEGERKKSNARLFEQEIGRFLCRQEKADKYWAVWK